jgi:protein-disulfide isomerase
MPTPRSAQLAAHFIENPASSGADVHFVRPKDHLPTRNPIAMNLISLCPHNSQNLCPLRPSNDADPLFLRHKRPFLTNNPRTMSSFSLCAVTESPCVITATSHTTYNLRPRVTIMNMRFPLLATLCLLSLAAQPKTKPAAFDKPKFEASIRHLLLPDPRVEVAIDDPKPSSVAGLKQIDVRLTYMGSTQHYLFFLSDNGQQVLYGKMFDINHTPFKADLDKIHTDLSPSFGAPGAPLVLVLYSDFQCPACKEEAKALRENIAKTYPAEVRVYFKDFPLESIHPWAKMGAICGRCVFRQDPVKFWDFYDWIYEHQAEINGENLKDKVLEFAKTNNLDTLQLSRCMENKATEADVDKSLAEGKTLDIDQTPTLFINGRRIPGAIPWTNLKSLIDAELPYAKANPESGEKCCEVKIPSVLNK